MRKTNKNGWEFQNTFTKEDLTTYPIKDLVSAAAASAGIELSPEREIKNKEKRKEAMIGVCPVCHKPMTYIGGNVVVCQNEGCTGMPYTVIEDGEEVTKYRYPVYRTLHINSQGYSEKILD